ncbi:MAG TPA: hypothetical protein VFO85_06725, partial [Vicinamibacteria bacterium]|nr:hypothetical protein [Vicinamibacteria bacterium]
MDLAAVGASLTRSKQLAAEALAAAPNARNQELSNDVFAAAERAIAAPGAAEAIATYSAVDATNIPSVVASFGGALGQPGAVPSQFAGREVTTVGRLTQTGPAGDAGERILRVPDNSWTPDLNALWMQD